MEVQNLTLTVTLEEANLLVNALQEMPARLANPLTHKLREQASVQLEKDVPKPPDVVPPPVTDNK